ncbi:isochorismate synthase [Opitutaceae bacterium EW11]|nr:isochorismate synthase [Opitutaceae bacterium EW11]
MTILPLDPRENETPEALFRFLSECQAVAVRKRHAQLVSISLEVESLDPLAVLESIFEAGEQHFYVEQPANGLAVAGAEAVLSFSANGPGRFAACQQFVDEALANALAVGDLASPFSGPHFFHAFSFFNDVGGTEPFSAATVFVPRWQVATREGRTTAVANLSIDAASPLELLAERIWRARKKFARFEYSAPGFRPASKPAAISVADVLAPGAYEASVAAAVRRIAAGEFQKIVLARARDLTADDAFHPLQVLNGLRQRYADCYSFSFANGKGQSLIGASPERLVEVRSGTISTEALAGSARRGASASEDAALGSGLLRSEKDLAEHAYVVQAIRRRLAPLGIDPTIPPRPVLKRLANVQHLQTPFRAALPASVRLLDVLAELHPTPAVGGSPREQALNGIRELETFPRGLYAGSVGWLDSRGEGEFFVALRSALVDGAQARIYAGAGIVDGSQPEQELAETELKFRALQDALTA